MGDCVISEQQRAAPSAPTLPARRAPTAAQGHGAPVSARDFSSSLEGMGKHREGGFPIKDTIGTVVSSL